jgi:adenylyl-sulfate kinase
VSRARSGLAIRWHDSALSDAARARRLKQKGGVVWLTGLSGSGKSTVARALEKALVDRGVHAAVLDGDNLRHGLNRDAKLLRAAGASARAARRFGLGFSAEDRRENIRRAAEAAALFARNNVLAIVALISPFRVDRAAARALVPGRFLEVHCAAPLAVCEARDPKGLYKKARAGALKQFTGLTSPYEPPRRPELTLDTGAETLAGSVERLLRLLQRRRFF